MREAPWQLFRMINFSHQIPIFWYARNIEIALVPKYRQHADLKAFLMQMCRQSVQTDVNITIFF